MKLMDDLLALGRRPRFHGNGFTQLQVTDAARLHVWHPDLGPIPDHNATIHDHVFDMRSTVLFGEILHRTYVVSGGKSSVYYDQYRVGRQEDRLLPCGHKIPYRMDSEYRMCTGSSYWFPAMHMHDTTHDTLDPAATLMVKTQVKNLEPLVLCPVGETPVDAFDLKYQPEEEAMWMAIEQAVLLMPEKSLLLVEQVLREPG